MPKQVTVASENRLCQSRIKAGERNPEFLSRPGAVKYLPGVSEECLKKWELGINNPSNDIIALMADAYDDTTLCNWYCASQCPLGKYTREIEEMPPERALIRLQNSSVDIEQAANVLRKMMDDGKITDDEQDLIPYVIDNLTKSRQRIDENLAALERAVKRGTFNR